MADDPHDSGGVQRISALVRRAIDSGTSARALSRATGDVVAHQYFTALANGRIKGWPKHPATITHISDALGVDTRAVVLGFAADLGLEVRESRSALAAQLPAAAETLDPKQISVIRDLIGWLGEANVAHVRKSSPRDSAGGRILRMGRALGLDEEEDFEVEAAYESPEPAGHPEPEQP